MYKLIKPFGFKRNINCIHCLFETKSKNDFNENSIILNMYQFEVNGKFKVM